MIQAAYARRGQPGKAGPALRRELELCQVKQGETIAVVSDLATRRE